MKFINIEIAKAGIDEIAKLIIEYLKLGGNDDNYFYQKVYLECLKADKKNSLLLLFTFFKELDKAIENIDTIDNKDTYTGFYFKNSVLKYHTYFINENNDKPSDIILNTLKNNFGYIL